MSASLVNDQEMDEAKQRGSKIRNKLLDKTKDIGLREEEGHFLYGGKKKINVATGRYGKLSRDSVSLHQIIQSLYLEIINYFLRQSQYSRRKINLPYYPNSL